MPVIKNALNFIIFLQLIVHKDLDGARQTEICQAEITSNEDRNIDQLRQILCM